MAEKNNAPRGRKPVKFTFNISWIYILLLIGIGWMFFNQSGANPQKKAEKKDVDPRDFECYFLYVIWFVSHYKF